MKTSKKCTPSCCQGAAFALCSSAAIAAALLALPTTAHAQIFEASGLGSGFSSVINELDASGGALVAPLIFGLDTVLSVKVSGSNLFVSSENIANGRWAISEYTTAGATVNASLISGSGPAPGILVSGSDLFVMNSNFGVDSISKYTTSGALVNASLIPGLSGPFAAAVSGGNLFLMSGSNGTIAEYTTSGAILDPSLVTGLTKPMGMAVSGSNLFVLDNFGGTIGKYTTSGATVNASLITGLGGDQIVAYGDNLFVTNVSVIIFGNPYVDSISEYTTAGATVNSSLVGGLAGPIAIDVVPEPSTWALLGTAGLSIAATRFFRRSGKQRRHTIRD